MKKATVTTKRAKAKKRALSKSRLDQLVEEATIDAHDEDEQVTGGWR